jgi:hypothetical protein
MRRPRWMRQVPQVGTASLVKIKGPGECIEHSIGR